MPKHSIDLQHFLLAQESFYTQALAELKNARKNTHWMWFIFPQITGLGTSPISQKFALENLAEARDYLNHPILGARLIECSQQLLSLQSHSALAIFGQPDNLKLQSCMTLFATIENSPVVFSQVLAHFFAGAEDKKTLAILSE